MQKVNQRGSSAVHILLLLVVAGLIGVTGWYVFKTNKDTNATLQNTTKGASETTETPAVNSLDDKKPANDDDLIAAAIQAYCVKPGVEGDVKATGEITARNMKDSNLYVKDGNFARLSAGCAGSDSGFRAFLRRSTGANGSAWKILGTTQMSTIACKDLDDTGIPKTIVADCYDEAGNLRAIK